MKFAMQIKSLLAIVALCLLGLAGPVWGAEVRGSAGCVSCHDKDDLPDMSGTAHAEAPSTKPPMADAAAALAKRAMGDASNPRSSTCVDCHGPSEAHSDDSADDSSGDSSKTKERAPPDVTFGKVFGKVSSIPAAQRSRVCEACHDRDAKRALWLGSQHQAADIACDNCHQVHTPRDKVLKKITQTEMCYACHKEQRAQMNKPSRHPVPEGKMGCSDCHNVHGSAGAKLTRRNGTNDTCYTCHAEKRGPFVRQHDPVVEDCSNCHNPHGSAVAGMLKVRAPMLCQQCHTPHTAGGVGAVGGQSGVYGVAAPGQTTALITATTGGKNVVNLWQGRSCMNCHTQVHGSNNPSTTNATPQRLMR